MTTNHNLADESSSRWPELAACLQNEYNVHPVQITQLELGADPYTTVFRVVDTEATAYFLKLRSADFNLATVAVPRWLADQSIAQIIAPIPCTDGRLFGQAGASAAILYPFVEGSDGFTVPLQDQHWVQLGQALRSIHAAAVPAELAAHIPREDYSPAWRVKVREYLAGIDEAQPGTPAAAGNDAAGDVAGDVAGDAAGAALRSFLRDRHAEIVDLVTQAEQLASTVQGLPQELVLCHADIHVGNVLIGAGGDFHIVDWDTVKFAPREHDLMFLGAGIASVWNPHEAELFYKGYGACTVDPHLLAYYRFERIVQDIAVDSVQLLASADDQERAGILQQLQGQFAPDGPIENAWRSLPG